MHQRYEPFACGMKHKQLYDERSQVVAGRHNHLEKHSDVAKVGECGSPLSRATKDRKIEDTCNQGEGQYNVAFRYFSRLGESNGALRAHLSGMRKIARDVAALQRPHVFVTQ